VPGSKPKRKSVDDSRPRISVLLITRTSGDAASTPSSRRTRSASDAGRKEELLRMLSDPCCAIQTSTPAVRT
jgi:hypothetical protein